MERCFGERVWLCDVAGFIGEMLGGYRQVLTRGDFTDDPSPVCSVRPAGRALRRRVRGSGARVRAYGLAELIEIEPAQVIRDARHERTLDRVTGRNGTRPKLLTTKGGMCA